MSEPVFSDPFDRWWADRRGVRRSEPQSADSAAARAAARDAWKAASERTAGAREPAAVDAEGPVITNAESYALHLGARALAEVAAGLERSGLRDLAVESASSAAALDDLQRRSTVAAAREQSTEQEAER